MMIIYQHCIRFTGIVFVSLLVPASCSETHSGAGTSVDSGVIAYDSTLAGELGADDYGMKRYVMAFLYAGPDRSQDSSTAASLQRAHLDNITRMAEEGKLLLAGPMMDDGHLRGIYVFNVETIEEARALTETDPAIQAGRLVMDLHPWYASATLPLIKDWHEKVAKLKI